MMQTATKNALRLINAQEIRRTWHLLTEPGQVVELRVLEASAERNGRFTNTLGGYFDNVDDLLKAAAQVQTALGVYITLQLCHPQLIHRAKNKLVKQKSGQSTPDNLIQRYRWLLIDSDPERVSHISSTDEEHEKALALSKHIRDILASEGWPLPIRADSGNGGHLLYRLDLPTDQEDLIKRVLAAIAARFNVPGISIDTTVYNPARICKLYGTLACKGDNTTERPHRMSQIIDIPDDLQPIPLALLETIAGRAPVAPPPVSRHEKAPSGDAFDMEGFIRKYSIDADERQPYQGGYKWILKQCPFCQEANGGACLFVTSSGAAAFRCLHNRCNGKDWRDFRAHYEPDAYTRPAPARKPQTTQATKQARPSGTGNDGDTPAKEIESGGSALPRIILVGQQHRNKRSVAIRALVQAEKHNPTIFVKAGRLVHIIVDERNYPSIALIGIAEMKNALSHSADYFKVKENGELSPISPSTDLAESILAPDPLDPWPFPPLEAIVEIPVIRSDGSILITRGYDKATRLYYLPHKELDAINIPDHPTQADMMAALTVVDDAIGEFPFSDQADRANAVALMLTPFIRPCVPLAGFALIDAPKMGTGKGLLTALVTIIATGRPPANFTYTPKEEEFKKSVTAMLLEGETIIVLDDVKHTLQSSSLDSVTTTETWKDRLLGVSKMIRMPQRATWIANGNNLRVGGDLVRRCYRIRLDPHMSRPWLRAVWKHENLRSWAKENRAALVTALLTLARAWFAAGQPTAANVPQLGSFEDWTKIIGGILAHCNIPGFLANLENLYNEADEENGQWEAFLTVWYKTFGSDWKTVKQLSDEIIKDADSAEDAADSDLALALPDPLQLDLKEKPNSFSIRLGKALEKRIETCYGDSNFRIERDKDSHTKGKKWRVVGDIADSADSHSSSTRKKGNVNKETDERKREENSKDRERNYPHYPQEQKQDVSLNGMNEPDKPTDNDGRESISENALSANESLSAPSLDFGNEAYQAQAAYLIKMGVPPPVGGCNGNHGDKGWWPVVRNGGRIARWECALCHPEIAEAAR
jgi:hypothetical protein